MGLLLVKNSFSIHDKAQLNTHIRVCEHIQKLGSIHTPEKQHPNCFIAIVVPEKSGLQFNTGASQPNFLSPQPWSNYLRENYNAH